MKAQKIFLFFLLFPLLSGAPYLHAAERTSESGLVVHIYDGDTILVEIGGKEEKVRLLGINTPEKDGPYTKAEPGWREASRRTTELSLKKMVILVYGGQTLRDKYKRLLAHVILPDGRVLNEILLEEGLAEAYRKYRYSNKKRYFKLQREAQKKCVGIWKVRGKCR